MALSLEDQARIGFVAIGRNEGERLQNCLRSLNDNYSNAPIVYVDSGSEDNSVSFARSLNCLIVELDMSKPFTAARARNEGWRHIIKIHPDLEFIHFLDGDCAIDAQWPQLALQYLEEHSDTAVVCGQRKELKPNDSIYNYFCDVEWNSPIGEAKACGGDALIRAAALQAVNGYNDKVIAGEEPEMCVRLRQKGWKIYRYDAIMTYHDAAMFKFSQWWKRTQRCGFAYALGASIHGADPERHWVAEKKRALFWACYLPIVPVLLSLLLLNPLPIFLLFLLYGLQTFRIYIKTPMKQHRLAWAIHSLLGKLPEAIGILKYKRIAAKNEQMHIMEYK